MIIEGLPQKTFTALSIETDDRFKNWVKIVTKVDPNGKDGYAFDGVFLNNGSVELKRFPYLLLAAGKCGSRRYATTTYKLAVLRDTGEIEDTGIGTTDEKSGWALRLRDPAIALLKTLQPAPAPVEPAPVEPTEDEITEEDQTTIQRIDEIVTVLLDRFPNDTRLGILFLAVARLEIATRDREGVKN